MPTPPEILKEIERIQKMIHQAQPEVVPGLPAAPDRGNQGLPPAVPVPKPEPEPIPPTHTPGLPEPMERPSIGGKPALQEVRGILDYIRSRQGQGLPQFGPLETEAQVLNRRYKSLVSAALEGLSYEDAAKRAKAEGVDQLNRAYYEHLRALKDKAEEIAAGGRAGYSESAAAREVKRPDRGTLLMMLSEVARQRQYARKIPYGETAVRAAGRGATSFAARPLGFLDKGLDDDQRVFRAQMMQAKEAADPLIDPSLPWYKGAPLKAAEMAVPMYGAMGAGRLAGGLAAGALGAAGADVGAGATWGTRAAVNVAQGVGAGGAFVPMIYDQNLDELLMEGIDPKVARRTAMVAAVAEGAIESFMPDPLRGKMGEAMGLVRQNVRQVMLGLARRFGAEWLEEFAQPLSTEIIKDVMARSEEQDKGLEHALGNAFGQFLEAGPPLAIMMAPGVAIEGGAQISEASRAKRNAQALQDYRDFQSQAAQVFKETQNAQQDEGPSPADANVRQPEGPEMGEGTRGPVPGPGSGQGVRPGGQGPQVEPVGERLPAAPEPGPEAGPQEPTIDQEGLAPNAFRVTYPDGKQEIIFGETFARAAVERWKRQQGGEEPPEAEPPAPEPVPVPPAPTPAAPTTQGPEKPAETSDTVSEKSGFEEEMGKVPVPEGAATSTLLDRLESAWQPTSDKREAAQNKAELEAALAGATDSEIREAYHASRGRLAPVVELVAQEAAERFRHARDVAEAAAQQGLPDFSFRDWIRGDIPVPDAVEEKPKKTTAATKKPAPLYPGYKAGDKVLVVVDGKQVEATVAEDAPEGGNRIHVLVSTPKWDGSGFYDRRIGYDKIQLPPQPHVTEAVEEKPKKTIGRRKQTAIPGMEGQVEDIEAREEREQKIQPYLERLAQLGGDQFAEGHRKPMATFEAKAREAIQQGKTDLDDLFEKLSEDSPEVPRSLSTNVREKSKAERDRILDDFRWDITGPPSVALATRVKDALATGPIDSKSLFDWAAEAYGGTRAEGKVEDSATYDALESGTNQYLLGQLPAGDTVQNTKAGIAWLEKMAAELPVHKARTGQKDTLQQFSTPPAYGYAATWAANISKGETVLEPSAGTGGLAVHALSAEGQVYANEIDPARAELLRLLPLAGVFTEDASKIHALLAGKMPAPSVVVMNPPFSREGKRMGQKRLPGTDRKHIDSALKLLRPGGRLVAIVGAGLHGRGANFAKWIDNLPYNVRAEIEVPREVYKGFGTTFPTRLLVIDKAPRTGQTVRGTAESLPDLVDLLEGVRNDRAPISEPEPAQPTRKKRPGKTGAGPKPPVSIQPPTGGVDTGRPPGGSPGPSGPVRGQAAGQRGNHAGVEAEPGPKAPGPNGPRAGERGGQAAGGGAREEQPRVPGKRPGGKPLGKAQAPGPEHGRSGRELRSKPAAGTESTYEPYVPHVRIEGAQKHPAAIVETAAMGAVDLPKINYRPDLPAEVIKGYTTESGVPVAISDIQLEGVAMAGEAHSRKLPSGPRKGVMIGDGPGLGKARIAAGIILDNFRRGRKKALWITANETLLDQAKEEWERVGRSADEILSHGKVRSGHKIAKKEGIVFTTYHRLRNEASAEARQAGHELSRVDQLVQWLGEDFDGAIIFDESHLMGNVSGGSKGEFGKKKPSAMALAGLDLDAKLPDARIVYFSATSATEVSNLGYATRLGLWGDGTPFANRQEFVGRISAGGVAAMEKVAADMKAMGVYLSRNISYNDGTEKGTVTYDRIEHELTPDQVTAYDKMAEAWGIVLRNVNDALGLTGADVDAAAKRNAMKQFYGAELRFFEQVITAMQVPTMLRAIERDLADEAEPKAVLIQLVNTNEAAQKRALEGRNPDEALEDMDLSPRHILMDYVERAFPTEMYEEYVDDNGKTRSRRVVDSEGNGVEDPQAVSMREQLLDELGSLQVANRGALDMIIDHFGESRVAEMTGRAQRIVEREGKRVIQKLPAKFKKADVNAFMDDKKQILAFSDAGGTGANYHADLNRKNQRKRHHYVLQAGWRADQAIQKMGRSHRANQKQAPSYFLVHTNLKGQKRFLSTIARRLAQVGALTKGERKAGESGLFSAADNLESTEARAALLEFYDDALAGLIPVADTRLLTTTLGLKVQDEDGHKPAEMPPITRFLNRMLALPVQQQNAIFDEFQNRLDTRVEQAIAQGTLDQGTETLRADHITKEAEQTVYRHESGAETKYVRLKVLRKTKPFPWSRVRKFVGREERGFVRSRTTGKVWGLTDTGSWVQDRYGSMERKLHMRGVMGIQYSTEDRLANTKYWEPLTEEEAEKAWAAETAKAPEMAESVTHMVTGVLLPIWDRLPEGNVQVRRLWTDEGEQILGRLIPEEEVRKVLRNLGASLEKPKLSSDQIVELLGRGGSVVLGNGWKLKRSMIDGEWNFELVGPEFMHNAEMERQGVFRRRIYSKTRYFIPTGEDAAAVITAVTKTRPVVDVFEPGTRQEMMEGRAATGAVIKQPLSQEPLGSEDTDADLAAADIQATWSRIFGVPIRQGGFRGKAAGVYKVLPESVRTREKHYANLVVVAHELAHHIDKHTGISGSAPAAETNELAGLDYEPKGRPVEGWAEFVRHYLTEWDTEDIAPGFHRWFTDVWAPENPVWKAKLDEARAHVKQYANQSVLQRVRAAIGRPGDDLAWGERWKQRARSGRRVFERRAIDKIGMLKVIQGEVAKRGGRATVYDFAMAYDRSAGPNSEMAFAHGVRDLVTGEILSRPLWGLKDHLQNDVEDDEAVAYAWAKHTLFMADLRPGYNTGFPGGIDQAKKWVEHVEAEPSKLERYEAWRLHLAEFANALLDMRLNAGAISPELHAHIKGLYGDNYFPLYRAGVVDRKRGLFSGASLSKIPHALRRRSREGSGRGIIHPVDALISRTLHDYGVAANQRVFEELQNSLDPDFGAPEGLAGLMEQIDPTSLPSRGTVAEILDTLVEEGFVDAEDAKAMKIASALREQAPVSKAQLDWFRGRHGLSENDSLKEAIAQEPDILSVVTFWRPNYAPNASKRIIMGHRAGKPYLYQVEPFLYDVVTDLHQVALPAFLGFLANAMRYFKAGAVGLSSAFGARNIGVDFSEYQGKAKYVKGPATLTKPPEMLARYMAGKAREAAGLPVNDPAVEEFDAGHGNLFSILGHDFRAHARLRKHKLSHSLARRLSVRSFGEAWHLLGTVPRAGLEALQTWIAWTDVPPRLAEMEAAIEEDGYRREGDHWVKIDTGAVATLPERTRIKGIQAAAEATINFKRTGTDLAAIEAFAPFARATVNAQYRSYQQLKSIGRGDAQGRRALIYLAALAALGAAHWRLRKDDDDYREQEPWLRFLYWTYGKNGKTYARFPKPRDWAIIPSMVEAILDAQYKGDKSRIPETLSQDLFNRLPSGGGLPRAVVEAYVANYDWFRGRPIEPEYTKNQPKALRATSRTLETSKLIGRFTGRYLGTSPAQVEHLLTGGSGGAYWRWTDTVEAAIEGRLGPEHIPWVRGYAMNRHQARSRDDFYEELDKSTKQLKWLEATEQDPSDALKERAYKLRSYASLMSQVLGAEKRSIGRRNFQYQPYLVGLAREALGRSPLDANPSPFFEAELPEPVAKAAFDYATSRARVVLLSEDRPELGPGESREDFRAREDAWLIKREASEKWLLEHQGSAITQNALRQVTRNRAYRNLLRGKGRPNETETDRKTPGRYQSRVKRWREKTKQARRTRKLFSEP